MLKVQIGRSEMVWEMKETVRKVFGNEQWDLSQSEPTLLMAQLAVQRIEGTGLSAGVHSDRHSAKLHATRRAKRATSRTSKAFPKAISSTPHTHSSNFFDSVQHLNRRHSRSAFLKN